MTNAKVAISLRLDSDLHSQVQSESRQTDISMNEVIATALKQYFNNRILIEHLDTGNPDYKIRITKMSNILHAHLYQTSNNIDQFSMVNIPYNSGSYQVIRQYMIENLIATIPVIANCLKNQE